MLGNQIDEIKWDGTSDISKTFEVLRHLADSASSPDEIKKITRRIAQISREYRIRTGIGLPTSPLAQALELDPDFRVLPHLEYLSERFSNAVRDVERGKNRKITVSMPPRSGKALALDTPLPTPAGWTTIGEVQVGDYIFDDRGNPTKVVAVSPVWTDRPCYSVTSNDGHEIIADEDHEWSLSLERRRPDKIYTTKTLAKSRAKRAMVRVQGALNLPPQDLPIPPYTLGAWLGDGRTNYGSITAYDQEILTFIEQDGFVLRKQGQPHQYGILGLQKLLRVNGLLGNKHVPIAYLRGSVEQREAVLQGLIDTDGHVGPTGEVEFTSTKAELAYAVKELALSLGVKASIIEGRATLEGRDCGPKWRVHFYYEKAARLPRKRELCRSTETRKNRYLRAELVESRATRCIQVDSPSHLFLAGSGFIPTHNSELISKRFPLWVLRRHPDWKIVQASYSGGLVADFAKWTRTTIEEKPELGVALSPYTGKRATWSTVEGGGIYSTSVRGGLTGRGARVVLIDDPIKDFIEAHSLTMRQNVWDWWLSVVQTRLEPPYLVCVVQTRWHEDDFTGRLLSPDFEGDPREWEQISIPAIAEDLDDIGRVSGDPLYTPVIEETRAEALDRWDDVKRAVGSYTWSALYQQRPAPARGAIFDVGWWRYWTSDPSKATEDGRVVFLDPDDLHSGKWIDSWDTSFKGSSSHTGAGSSADFVVGQRWCRQGVNRYLISQKRGRWSFTQTIEQMKQWIRTNDDYASPYGRYVHDRLIEDRANGSAIIDTLKEFVAGLKPINPSIGKEARARAVTPEVESGNVFLPLPSDEGNEWVQDFLSEIRNFPHDANDDQVDAMVQALAYLRDSGRGGLTVPGTKKSATASWQAPRDIARTALRDQSRRRY